MLVMTDRTVTVNLGTSSIIAIVSQLALRYIASDCINGLPNGGTVS